MNGMLPPRLKLQGYQWLIIQSMYAALVLLVILLRCPPAQLWQGIKPRNLISLAVYTPNKQLVLGTSQVSTVIIIVLYMPLPL